MNPTKKVLIIDDEEDACLLLKRYFAKRNCEVSCAYTLQEGLEKARTVKPDIIFLDNNLPDGLGWEHSLLLQDENPDAEINLISANNSVMINLNKFRRKVRVWQKPISFKKLDEQLSIRQAS